VSLADLLARAGMKRGAAHVHFLGGDGPPSPKTPPFFRSIPLEKALHPDTLLATGMNGVPLPDLHGGPVRLVVPGWAGNNWIKWVRAVTVSAAEAPGFYMQTGYRIPRKPAPPDAVLKPEDLVPVTAMNVKSLITAPARGARLQTGKVEVRGVAWTGEGQVAKVEVAVGPGSAPQWRGATLLVEPKPWSWCPWVFAFEAARPGPVLLRARATDSRGETQPETTPWNKSGYLWNGIDRVTCEVG
jgi:DMSO/TMAO reductase YedYZ molybdopterin-dependent catalytic subunit